MHNLWPLFETLMSYWKEEGKSTNIFDVIMVTT